MILNAPCLDQLIARSFFIYNRRGSLFLNLDLNLILL